MQQFCSDLICWSASDNQCTGWTRWVSFIDPLTPVSEKTNPQRKSESSLVRFQIRTFHLSSVYSVYLVSQEIILKSIESRMRTYETKNNPIKIMNKIPFSIVKLIFKVVSNHSFKTFNKVLLSSLSIMTCWSTPIIEFSMNCLSSLLRRDKPLLRVRGTHGDKYSGIFCKSLRTTL